MTGVQTCALPISPVIGRSESLQAGGYPLRTGLSVLAMAIGVAAVVVLTALGDGARRYVVDQFSALGSNLVIVQADSSKAVGARLRTGTVQTMTQDDAEAMNRLPTVKGAAPMLTVFSQISYGNDNSNNQVQGTTPVAFSRMVSPGREAMDDAVDALASRLDLGGHGEVGHDEQAVAGGPEQQRDQHPGLQREALEARWRGEHPDVGERRHRAACEKEGCAASVAAPAAVAPLADDHRRAEVPEPRDRDQRAGHRRRNAEVFGEVEEDDEAHRPEQGARAQCAAGPAQRHAARHAGHGAAQDASAGFGGAIVRSFQYSIEYIGRSVRRIT